MYVCVYIHVRERGAPGCESRKSLARRVSLLHARCPFFHIRVLRLRPFSSSSSSFSSLSFFFPRVCVYIRSTRENNPRERESELDVATCTYVYTIYKIFFRPREDLKFPFVARKSVDIARRLLIYPARKRTRKSIRRQCTRILREWGEISQESAGAIHSARERAGIR